MALSTILNWFGKRRRVDPAHSTYFQSPEQLRNTLQRERLRSDRSGAAFCLLTLTARGESFTTEQLSEIATHFQQRLRATDEAGLLDERRLGLMLPETPSAGAWKLADDLCTLCEPRFASEQTHVYAYPSFQKDDDNRNSNQGDAGDRPVRALEAFFQQPLPVWKRGLDVVGAVGGLVALSPLLAAAAIAVKCSSPGPIFFWQERDGLGGRSFHMLKFRTMRSGAHAEQDSLRENNEQDGPAFKLTNDPRVTAVGKFLRKTSIDELPQLWNVLRGEMSIVGPRPLPCEESRACETWQRRRLDVTPGLTCIWQVRGRSQVTFPEWIRMDLAYAKARTFWHDVKLILATVPAVLLRRGAK